MLFTKDTSDKGLILKVSKKLIKLNTKRKKQQAKPKNNPIKKWAEDLNSHFSKQDIQMVYRHIKRCTASLVIKEMPIKTTIRYHLIPVRMSIINKLTNNSAGEDVKKREPLCTVGGNADWYSNCGKQYIVFPKS